MYNSQMAKSEITPSEKKMLEELQAGFPALVRDMQAAVKAAQALNLKLAAHASMFQAYGWPIPEVEGLLIQHAPLPPAAQAALQQAMQQGAPPVVVPPPPITPASPVKAGRGSIKKYVSEVLESSELSVADLREQIQKKYGVLFGVSSIYRILKDKTTYLKHSGKWRLKK